MGNVFWLNKSLAIDIVRLKGDDIYEKQWNIRGLRLRAGRYDRVKKCNSRNSCDADGPGLQLGGYLFHRPDPQCLSGRGGFARHTGFPDFYGAWYGVRRRRHLGHLPGAWGKTDGLRLKGIGILYVVLCRGGDRGGGSVLSLYGRTAPADRSQYGNLGADQGLPEHCDPLRAICADRELFFQHPARGGSADPGDDRHGGRQSAECRS